MREKRHRSRPDAASCVRRTRSHEFKAAAPLLIIVPAALIDFWEGEWQFWTPGQPQQPQQQQAAGNGAAAAPPGSSGINLVVYSGNSSARGVLLEHELWLNPSSMDVKMNVGFMDVKMNVGSMSCYMDVHVPWMSR